MHSFTTPGWADFALREETRLLLWCLTAFVLSGRAGLLVRSCILFCCISQVWTVVVFALYGLGLWVPGAPIEAIAMAAALMWLLSRPYDVPSGTVRATGLPDQGTYIVIKRPSTRKMLDLVVSFFGLPFRTVHIYHNGYLYGMFKTAKGLSRKLPAEVSGLANQYAIKLHVDPRYMRDLLDGLLGQKFNLFRNNCVSCFRPVWKIAGLSMPRVCYYVPGLFLLGLRFQRGEI